VRGGATISPRCPLPTGVTRSITRIEISSGPASRVSRCVGCRGVRSWKAALGPGGARTRGVAPSAWLAGGGFPFAILPIMDVLLSLGQGESRTRSSEVERDRRGGDRGRRRASGRVARVPPGAGLRRPTAGPVHGAVFTCGRRGKSVGAVWK